MYKSWYLNEFGKLSIWSGSYETYDDALGSIRREWLGRDAVILSDREATPQRLRQEAARLSANMERVLAEDPELAARLDEKFTGAAS